MLGRVGQVAQGLESLRDVARISATACTRQHGSGCTACVDACPQAALTVTDPHGPPAVSALSCIGCGVCVPACPTDAVGGVGTPPEDLARAARDNQDGLAVRCGALAGSELPPTPGGPGAVLGVWCLGALHPETLAGAAAGMSSEASLTLLHADCESCPVRAAGQVRDTVEAAASLARRSGAAAVTGVRVEAPAARQETSGKDVGGAGAPEQTSRGRRAGRARSSPVRQKPAMSRRALFGSLLGRAEEPDVEDARAQGAARPVGSGPTDGPDAPNRPGRPLLAPGAVTRARGVLLAAAPRTALPRPHAVSGCTACQACTAICPTQALSWLGSPTASALLADPAACIACGECVRVCPEEVLSLTCPLPAPGRPDRGNDPVLLTRVPRARCTRCARTLTADERGLCTGCSSRRAMLDDVWTQDARR